MANALEPLRQLGGSVASALEGARSGRARAVEDAGRGFLLYELNARQRATRTSPKPRLWAAAVFGVGVATIAAVLHFTSRPPALTFDVEGVAGATKSWLAAPKDAPLRLQFSEHTKVRLEAGSRARVMELDPRGASLSLESGRLHAEVVHQPDATWKVVAGPFTVAVTGTVFDVNWDPSTEQLAVSVERGSVAVRDSNTGAEQAVRASQTLRSTSPEHHFALNAPPSGETLPEDSSAELALEKAEASAEDAAQEVPKQGRAEPVEVAELKTVRAGTPKTEWRAYAKRGALREAFASAEAEGFAMTCAGASPAELLLLGDGARLSGKPGRASEALLALRRRFPKDPRRSAAAFSLGKVAFDQMGAYEQAAEWFAKSLHEQPNGPLARECSGRLIEALRRASDAAGARRAARDYLLKYPEGPHADLARSALY